MTGAARENREGPAMSGQSSQSPSAPLRLLVPQWQGGNSEAYALGARLLTWLAPPGRGDTVEVPVAARPPASDGDEALFARADLSAQFHAAREIIEIRQPQRIVTFGGDCFVSLAPFSYLRRRYGEGLGVLWIDAHPDVGTPRDFRHAHTMVLGTLLGYGDPQFAAECRPVLAREKVLLVGLEETREAYSRFVREHELQIIRSSELRTGYDGVRQWLADQQIQQLAVHFDLDVLQPSAFRSQSFAKPELGATKFDMAGTLELDEVVRLLGEVSSRCDLVGLTIAEHTPWDAINLKRALAEIALLSE